MDGGCVPNGIGHLIMLFMAGGIYHTHLCTYIIIRSISVVVFGVYALPDYISRKLCFGVIYN